MAEAGGRANKGGVSSRSIIQQRISGDDNLRADLCYNDFFVLGTSVLVDRFSCNEGMKAFRSGGCSIVSS